MVGLTTTASRVNQRISMSHRSLKKQVLKSSKKIASDGQRVMRLMVPYDTGALENAVLGWVDNDPTGDVQVHIAVSPLAMNEKRGVPVIRYATFMDNGFQTVNGVWHRPYKLGKGSLDKVARARPYAVGMNFSRRLKRYIKQHYRDEYLKAVDRAGMKARWR